MLLLNGQSVFDARLYFPRTGAWFADLRIDSADAAGSTAGIFAGDVTIDVDGKLTLKGSAVRGGVYLDTGYLRVVGGAGGLGLTAKARHFSGSSVGTVLSDLLRAPIGEKLSSTSDPAILGLFLQSWTTAALSAGRMISRVLLSVAPTATWRVLPDGTIFVGNETWPDSGLIDDDDFQILSESPEMAEATIGLKSPLLMPGTLLGDRRVSYVEYRLSDPETRAIVYFEDGSGDDRLKRAIRGMVRGAQQPIDYLSMFVGTVVAQSGGRIDVKPDDSRIPTMAGVPLFASPPQWSLSVAPGGKVLVGWSGGDPKSAFAIGFDADVAAVSLGIECPSVTIGTATAAQPAILSTPYRAAEDAFLSALVVATSAALSALGLGGASATLASAKSAFQLASQTYLSTQVKHS